MVEKARAAFGLKPALPDFYNILLERPRHDPAGYGEWHLPLNFTLNWPCLIVYMCLSRTAVCGCVAEGQHGQVCI